MEKLTIDPLKMGSEIEPEAVMVTLDPFKSGYGVTSIELILRISVTFPQDLSGVSAKITTAVAAERRRVKNCISLHHWIEGKRRVYIARNWSGR